MVSAPLVNLLSPSTCRQSSKNPTRPTRHYISTPSLSACPTKQSSAPKKHQPPQTYNSGSLQTKKAISNEINNKFSLLPFPNIVGLSRSRNLKTLPSNPPYWPKLSADRNRSQLPPGQPKIASLYPDLRSSASRTG